MVEDGLVILDKTKIKKTITIKTKQKKKRGRKIGSFFLPLSLFVMGHVQQGDWRSVGFIYLLAGEKVLVQRRRFL